MAKRTDSSNAKHDVPLEDLFMLRKLGRIVRSSVSGVGKASQSGDPADYAVKKAKHQCLRNGERMVREGIRMIHAGMS